MSGLPAPVPLSDIINDLFQNERIRIDDNIVDEIIFSRAKLTPAQEKQLQYPEGFNPLNFYLIYQTSRYQDKHLISSRIQLVSFIEKQGHYIYGYYFNVLHQDPYSCYDLIRSRNPVEVSSQATITATQYLEVYNDVNGTTVILALSTFDKPYASLQYSHGCLYYFEQLASEGIVDIKIPKTKLTGVSKNLIK